MSVYLGNKFVFFILIKEGENKCINTQSVIVSKWEKKLSEIFFAMTVGWEIWNFDGYKDELQHSVCQ